MALNISKARIIREQRRASRPASRGLPAVLRMAYLLVGAWTFASASGCQLIVGELPGNWDGGAKDDRDGAPDASPETDASGNGADADEPDAGDAPHDAAQHDAEEGADADAESMDAAGGGDADSSAVPMEASLPDADPTACDGAGEKVFYRDSDKDGYGDGMKPMLACSAPDGYVANDGDCHDGLVDVNEGQTKFFGRPYAIAGSARESFDYDCDGHEVGGPGQQQYRACSSGLLGCSGSGYEENPERVGMPDSYCGSSQLVTCGSGLGGVLGGCGMDIATTNSPYVCH